MGGDDVSIVPTLHGGVVTMAELFGHRADAAKTADDIPDTHANVVRITGTTVKLERVRDFERYSFTMGSYENSVGLKLRALKARTDLSLKQIADAMNRPKSTLQRMFEVDYRPNGVLDLEDAIAFAVVFQGKGSPAIRRDDVLALTALPQVSDAFGPTLKDIPPEVTLAMAEVYADVILEGRTPAPGVVESLAGIIRELSLLYQLDPTMRADGPRTRGALQSLALRSSQKAHEPR